SNIATVTINIEEPIILPVNLQSFNAVYNQPDVELSWVSAEETNFSHYEIERSADGIHYSKQAVILGSAFSTSEKTYDYIDNKIGQLNGIIYYRLTAVDKNGKMSSSTVMTVQIGQATMFSISTFPNPVINAARIMLPASWASNMINIEVYNQSGQKLQNVKKDIPGQFIDLNLTGLADGIYIIKAVSGIETAVQKIFKN